ncbi:MAG: MlaC/ttg2D family ABC transporter substrate-binding protein [Burkholderiaceae bacterium]
MKMLNKLLTLAVTACALSFASVAIAEEAPDALVKRISHEVLDAAKTDKEIQSGNQKRVLDLVEAKIIPYVDFQRMTSLAAGRYWREATPEQQQKLTAEFRSLLVYTYSGAISQVKDQKIDFKPMRSDPADTEVEVRTLVIQPRGEPIQLYYRLEKLPTGWRIYDVNILGAWLVEAYKGNFATEISKGGIDGLINTLAEKNKRLAASAAKVAKAS